MDQKLAMEIQAGADALLKQGGGGVAVWVRRDELSPRVAVRFRTAAEEGEDIPAEKIAAILGTLHIGVDRMTQALADSMGMPREDLAKMVEIARKELMPHYETATNIIR